MQNTSKIYDLQSFATLPLAGKKVGILGGSFNPAHAGHLAVSQKALELGLDYILWLVAPQNPLKPPYESSLKKRVELASQLVKCNPQIMVSFLEDEIKTTNTYDTLSYLTSHFPKTDFIWLMGVDCLKEFHLWENYDKFPELVDIMIFNRDGYEDLLVNSIAGKLLKAKSCKKYESGVIFVEEKLSGLSSTEIREMTQSGMHH
jgi:nicotinate-nucleotide adenylyltransferase